MPGGEGNVDVNRLFLVRRTRNLQTHTETCGEIHRKKTTTVHFLAGEDRSPTLTSVYLYFSSHHPQHLKPGVIETLLSTLLKPELAIHPRGTSVLWGISQGETSSWWTTAAIQRCSQTTPKGYTHHRRLLGDSCTRSTTVEAGHSQRKEPH